MSEMRKMIILDHLIDIIKSYVRVIDNDIQKEIEDGCNNLYTLADIIQDKILVIDKITEKAKNGK